MGKVDHVDSGHYAAQGGNDWFGDVVKNDFYRVDGTNREPGQDGADNDGPYQQINQNDYSSHQCFDDSTPL